MKNIYIIHRDSDYDTPYLEHYGVKGMEWGKKKSPDDIANSLFEKSKMHATAANMSLGATSAVNAQRSREIKAQVEKSGNEAVYKNLQKQLQKYKKESQEWKNTLSMRGGYVRAQEEAVKSAQEKYMDALKSKNTKDMTRFSTLLKEAKNKLRQYEEDRKDAERKYDEVEKKFQTTLDSITKMDYARAQK